MKPTAEQIARLPKWAQDHIEMLERDRDRARAGNAERDGEVGATNTFLRDLDSMAHGGPGRPLPKGEQVRFVVDPDDREAFVDVWLNDTARGPEGAGAGCVLEIRGGRSLMVLPRVSNSLTVRPLTWEEYTSHTRLATPSDLSSEVGS